jgi:DNA phosphorothioation-associated putative methyltransferase
LGCNCFYLSLLKIYIDQVLGVDAVPAALGIYFVFRDEAQAQSFRASRFRSRVSVPKVQLANKRFEDYEKLLTPLMAFFTERGRLPTLEELPETEALSTEFGNLRRAFQIVLQATNPQEWDAISDRRRQDLLVYFSDSYWTSGSASVARNKRTEPVKNNPVDTDIILLVALDPEYLTKH